MTAPATSSDAKLTVPCGACRTLNRVALARLGDGPRCAACKAPLALEHPVALGDADLARVVADSPVPVLVDFYADWCGPCKMMAPSVDELASAYQGRALVGKLNTDLAQRTSTGLAIRGIPTVIVYRGGKEIARQTGAVPKARLEELLRAALG